MKRKLHLFIILLFVLCLCSPLTLFGTEPIRVILDNKELKFDRILQQNNRIFVPMRQLFEELGYTLQWDDTTKTVNGKKGASSIQLTLNDTTAYKDNEKILLDCPPLLLDSKTMVPLRFIAESTGASVHWNTTTNTVTILTQNSTSQTQQTLSLPKSIFDSIVMIDTNRIQGSGFIISSDGLIATNYHVIEKASGVTITFQDKTTYTDKITVVGFDISKDIAIIKINKTNLPTVTLGDSSNITVGQTVTAIGSPMGNLNTKTQGVITGFNHHIINTTALIEHGSSGGVLLNEKEEVIGITSSYDEEKNYYSIPVNRLKNLGMSGNYSLADMAYLTTDIPLPPTDFLVDIDGETAHIFWSPVYGVDGYHVYMSHTKDGEYKKMDNPKKKSDLWYWGYPYSFGVTTKKGGLYFKFTSVKGNKESDFSEIVEAIPSES